MAITHCGIARHLFGVRGFGANLGAQMALDLSGLQRGSKHPDVLDRLRADRLAKSERPPLGQQCFLLDETRTRILASYRACGHRTEPGSRHLYTEKMSVVS